MFNLSHLVDNIYVLFFSVTNTIQMNVVAPFHNHFIKFAQNVQATVGRIYSHAQVCMLT